MLEGEVVYRHGSRTYLLTPGDSLYFDADAPHGPEELRRLPIRYLSVISYAREAEPRQCSTRTRVRASSAADAFLVGNDVSCS